MFFFQIETASEVKKGLVGWEMRIRDRACVAGAFVLRLGRRRAGSAPAALAANAWAELGLAPGLVAGVALAVLSQQGVDVRSDLSLIHL